MASGSRWRGMARRAVEVCTRRKPVDMVDTIGAGFFVGRLVTLTTAPMTL